MVAGLRPISGFSSRRHFSIGNRSFARHKGHSMNKLPCRSPKLPALFAALITTLAVASLEAGDWPQILGPYRNGRAVDERPIEAWGDEGPRKLWSYPLGEGYAGPAVVGRRVVVFHRDGDRERIECLDLFTGQSQWKTDFPATYRGGINPDNGPRCVPLIHGDRVYVFGAAGDLHCVDLTSGKPRWSCETHERFDAQEGYFGAGSSPVVAGGYLLLNVGGRNAGLVAFDLEDGRVVWQATDERASYSSPTMIRSDGKDTAVFVTRLNVVGVEPSSGKIRFQFPFGQRGPTVNAATPLGFDEYVFVSASYGIGARLAKLGGDNVEVVWENDSTMSSQFSTCVLHEGFFYGIHGREDVPPSELRCFEALNGKIQWRIPDFPTGHLIIVDDRLLVLTTDGRLILAPASSRAFQPLAETRVSSGVTRALPAFSQGRLLLRDNSGGRSGRLHCLALREPP
jgi:outer membrane protein assembly factor BamB